jgi:hypothetical protein
VAKLEVHVVAPERQVFSGEADMVVAKGSEGDVGILPGHASMLIGRERRSTAGAPRKRDRSRPRQSWPRR